MDGLILPCRDYWPAALNNAGTAVPLVDVYGSPQNPTPTVLTGVNLDRAVLSFPDAQDAYAQFAWRLPEDFYVPGGLAARVLWSTPSTTGSVRWDIYTAFVAADAGLDPAFNTVTSVVTAAGVSAGVARVSAFAALDLTGAAPGALMMVQFGRANGADDLGDEADLIGIELRYQRRVVLP